MPSLVSRSGAALLLALAALPQAARAQHALTAEQWRADLRVLADSLPRRHREPFTRVRREAFDSAVAQLHARIPALDDAQVVVELASLVAMLRDGHTRLTLPQSPVAWSRSHTPTPPPRDSSLVMDHLPLRLEWFPEGLFVRGAAPELQGLIGARVVEIGGSTADSALERTRRLANYDNEMGFRQLAPVFLVVPQVLVALGIEDDARRTRLVVEAGAGRDTLTLEPLPRAGATELLEASRVAPGPLPLRARRRDVPFWMEPLPARRALYIQFNEVADAPDEPLRLFAARVEAAMRDPAVDRVVLDLRYNPGGNNSLYRPLLLALIRSERINRPGRLFVLIGRETFSAAQNLVNDLEYLTSALFVGEPSGSSPSHYGDSRRMLLPNSGLTVRISSVYWRDASGNERRPWTPPHLPADMTAAAYFANGDPVLDVALAFRPADLAALVGEVARRGGLDRAANVVSRVLRDPFFADEDVEPALLAGGRALLEGSRPQDAVPWFQFAAGATPRSAAVQVGLARALERAGRRADALAALDAALRIDPAHAEARALRASLAPAP